MKKINNFHRKHRYFLPLFASGLLLLGLFFSLNQVRKQQNLSQHAQTAIDPLTDWKTFTSYDETFSFKYPQRLDEDPDIPNGILLPVLELGEYQKSFLDPTTYHQDSNLVVEKLDTGVRFDGLFILVFPNTDDLSLREWAEKYKDFVSSAYSGTTQKTYNPSLSYISLPNSQYWAHITGYDTFPVNLFATKLKNGKIFAVNKVEKSIGTFTDESDIILRNFDFSGNPTTTTGPTSTLPSPTVSSSPVCSQFTTSLAPLPGILSSARGKASITLNNKTNQSTNEVGYNYSIAFDNLPQSEIIDMYLTTPASQQFYLGIGTNLLDGVNKKEYSGEDYMSISDLAKVRNETLLIQIDTEGHPNAELAGVVKCVSQDNVQQLTPVPSPTSNSPFPNVSPAASNLPNMKVSVSIKIPGIGLGGNKLPKNLSRAVFLGAYNLNDELVAVGKGFATYDGKNIFKGTINLGGMESGTYYIRITSGYSLIKRIIPEFQKLDNKKVNELPQITLYQGAVSPDGDNVIDIKDYNNYLECFFRRGGCKADFTYAIDINDDGKQDVTDYNLFLANFRQLSGD